MNTNTITQPRMTDLDILKGARKILETSWCAGSFSAVHSDGVRYCAVGAMFKAATHPNFNDAFAWLTGLTDPSAIALYPEATRGVYLTSPTIYVNDHLGREAVLRVFDAAILDIELRLSIESGEPQIEMEKQEVNRMNTNTIAAFLLACPGIVAIVRLAIALQHPSVIAQFVAHVARVAH